MWSIFLDATSLCGFSANTFQVIAAIKLLEQWDLVEYLGSQGPAAQHEVYAWKGEAV